MSDDLYSGDESSGLLTHFTGRVKSGFWSTLFAETDGKASQDFAHNTMLFWHVDVLDILQLNYESSGPPVESILVSFGIGKGWSVDPSNPNLVEHEDDVEGHFKKFRAETALMRFAYAVNGDTKAYQNAVVLDGDGKLDPIDLTGIKRVHSEKGVKTLRDATVWDYLVMEFRGLGFKTRQSPDPKAKATPVRYIGYDDSEVVDLAKYASGRSQGSRINPAGAAQGGLGSVPPERVEAWRTAGASDPTVALLTRVWESSASVPTFVGNAGLLPDVKANEELAKEIIDTPDPTDSE